MTLTPIPDHCHRPGFQYPKSLLAYHLTTPHQQADGSVKRIAMPSKVLRQWSREELEQAHHDLHDS